MTKLKTMVVNVGKNSLGFSEVSENVLSPDIDVGYMEELFVNVKH